MKNSRLLRESNTLLHSESFPMTPWQSRVTELTQRMADDMKLRNFAQATIDAYTYHVGRFAEFLGKSLEQASPEDVRSFQLHLIEVRKVRRRTADASCRSGALVRSRWSAPVGPLPLVAARSANSAVQASFADVISYAIASRGVPVRKCSAGKK